MLGHLLVGTCKECIDDTAGEGMEFIRRDVLPLKRMANLSCSLLGTSFSLPCFHFLPDNEGKKPWKESVSVSEEMLSEQNYNYYPEVTVVGWGIQALESRPLPYPRLFAKKTEFEAYQKSAVDVAAERNVEIVQQEWAELLEDEQNKKMRVADFKGETRCNHAPTMLNYWHFTIDLYAANNNDNPLKRISKGWSEKMATNLQDYLCRTFVHLTDEAQVPRIAYEHICEI